MISRKQLTHGIAGFMVMFILILMIIVVVMHFPPIPTVGSTEDGKCIWIEQAPDFDRRACPMVMPEVYNHVFVDRESK